MGVGLPGRGAAPGPGCCGGFRVVPDDAPSGPDHDLPDEDGWWDEVVGDGLPPSYFAAVADLDLVADDCWPAALELISGDRSARDALAPVDGRPSYTTWWLSRFALLDGRPPTVWRLTAATDLAGLYDPLPVPLTDELAPPPSASGPDWPRCWPMHPEELLRPLHRPGADRCRPVTCRP